MIKLREGVFAKLFRKYNEEFVQFENIRGI
jgi:hypothetical protein